MDTNFPITLQSSIPEKLEEIYSFRRHTISDLRTELGHLKTCQTTLFVCICTGFCLFFGVISKTNDLSLSNLFLIPLILILPLWIIFFEKARTISRIVGFLRVQEKLYMYHSPCAVVGWESAMREYKRKKKTWDDRYFDHMFEETDNMKSPISSVYWFTVFCTFSLMAIICLIMSGLFLKVPLFDKIIFFLGLLLVVLGYELMRLYKHWIKDKNKKSMKGISAKWDEGTLDKNSPSTISMPENGKNKVIQNQGLIIIPSIRHTGLTQHFSNSLCFTIIFVAVVVSPRLFWYISSIFYDPLDSLKIFASFGSVDYWIYLAFLASFFLVSNVTLWMFRNLVHGRYSYDKFESRWKIILDIDINEDDRSVSPIMWEQNRSEHYDLRKDGTVSTPNQ